MIYLRRARGEGEGRGTTILCRCFQVIGRFVPMHKLLAVGRFGLVVAMSMYVFLDISLPSVIFVEAPHWPTDHMISLRPLIV